MKTTKETTKERFLRRGLTWEWSQEKPYEFTAYAPDLGRRIVVQQKTDPHQFQFLMDGLRNRVFTPQP